MNWDFIFGVLLGILAALMLNIGKGIQKQKVHVFLKGRGMFARANRKDLSFWCLGLAITAGAALPYSLGLWLTKSPSTIAAMTGVGLIGLLVYAVKVIGEKIGRRDGVGIALVIVGKHSESISPVLSEEKVEWEKVRPDRLPLEEFVYVDAVGS